MNKSYETPIIEFYLDGNGNVITCSSTDDLGTWKPGWNGIGG